MAESEFIPSERPGDFVSMIEGVGNTAQSWMTSAQNRKIQAAQEQRAQQSFDILKPVQEAKAKADIAEQLVSLDGAEQTEKARANSYGMLPTARQDFNDMMLTADPDSRVQNARDWLGKYAQLDSVKELQPEIKSYKDAIAGILTENLAMKHYDSAIAVAETGAASREAVAGTAAGSREAVAGTAAESRVEAANIRAQAASPLEKQVMSIKAAEKAGDTESADLLREALDKKSGGKSYELEQSISLRDEALADGDKERAQMYQDRINKIDSFAAAPINRNLPASGRPAAPKAPAATALPRITLPSDAPVLSSPMTVPKDATSVKIGEKTYPLATDSKGNRAYLIDGHYVEVKTE